MNAISIQSEHDPFTGSRGYGVAFEDVSVASLHHCRHWNKRPRGLAMHADWEQQLLHRLRVSLAEDARGFTVEPAGPSGVLILNKGHYRGVWRWANGSYAFTPGGYASSTHSAPTPQEAVRFTLDHVCRQ
jgi:hypothetical protein